MIMKKGQVLHFYYQCINCKSIYSTDQTIYLCPECSADNSNTAPPKGILKVNYDYSEIRISCPDLEKLTRIQFLPLMPFRSLSVLPKLRVGNTPLYDFSDLSAKWPPHRLFIKDDSQNPTYSFKDRASAVVSAYALEMGYDTIIAASTGNAGSSLAGICAAQNQKAIVLVPHTAPAAKLLQIMMYGAKIIPVNGNYDIAFELSIKATEEFGWYNRNTAYNPLTIEGKKTVSFEILHQLNGEVPDKIFVPAGDGVIVSGVYKGFEDLLKLGFIDKIPVVVAVQSVGSDNLVRNIGSEQFVIKRSSTIADSISVDIPRNFYMAEQYITKYKGECITVPDEEILKASSIMAEKTGLFAEPAASAAYAAYLYYRENQLLNENSLNVVLSTGSGLKDLKPYQQNLKIPEAISPEIDELKKIL